MPHKLAAILFKVQVMIKLSLTIYIILDQNKRLEISASLQNVIIRFTVSHEITGNIVFVQQTALAVQIRITIFQLTQFRLYKVAYLRLQQLVRIIKLNLIISSNSKSSHMTAFSSNLYIAHILTKHPQNYILFLLWGVNELKLLVESRTSYRIYLLV